MLPMAHEIESESLRWPFGIWSLPSFFIVFLTFLRIGCAPSLASLFSGSLRHQAVFYFVAYACAVLLQKMLLFPLSSHSSFKPEIKYHWPSTPNLTEVLPITHSTHAVLFKFTVLLKVRDYIFLRLLRIGSSVRQWILRRYKCLLLLYPLVSSTVLIHWVDVQCFLNGGLR